MVRTSLLASVVGVHAFQGTRWTAAGEVGLAQGNHHPSICFYGLFRCADGLVQIAVGSERLWRSFCAEFDLDPDADGLGSHPARVASRELVTYEWDQTRSQGLLVEVEHDSLGRITLPGPRFVSSPPEQGAERETTRQAHLPPPVLDADAEGVRDWVGS